MGLKCSPYIAQSAMENVLAGIDEAGVYINDVGAFSSSWQEHLNLLDTILCHLSDNGFTVKLNCAQKNYTTTEKEMLSIVTTLEESRCMLLSDNIHEFTDHKNLTFDDLKTQRVLRWHNKIEAFFPWLHYIEGLKNILADNTPS